MVNYIQAGIAGGRKPPSLRGEKFLQTVGDGLKCDDLFLASTLVAPQPRDVTAIDIFGTLHERLGQSARILEPEIDAVSGQRMDCVGGVADQGKARADRTWCAHQPQGKPRGRRYQRKRAESARASIRDAFAECFGRQRQQLLRMIRRC